MTRSVQARGDRGQSDADAALVAGVRRSDRAAFETLFRVYATPLRAFAYRLVRQHEIAHELVQDLFLSIWAQRTTWAVHGAVSTYLFRAIRNLALNVVRRGGSHRRFEIAIETEPRAGWLTARPIGPDRLAEDRELADAIRRALDSLSERVRAVFRLAREEERTYAEIAAKLGVSVPTVERDMAKAVDALRRELASWRERRG